MRGFLYVISVKILFVQYMNLQYNFSIYNISIRYIIQRNSLNQMASIFFFDKGIIPSNCEPNNVFQHQKFHSLVLILCFCYLLFFYFHVNYVVYNIQLCYFESLQSALARCLCLAEQNYVMLKQRNDS